MFVECITYTMKLNIDDSIFMKDSKIESVTPDTYPTMINPKAISYITVGIMYEGNRYYCLFMNNEERLLVDKEGYDKILLNA